MALDGMILDALRRSRSPLGAYEIAHRLRERSVSLYSITIYRALERLCAMDLVERIDVRSSYRLREVPPGLLFVCDGCGEVVPIATGVARRGHRRLRHPRRAAGGMRGRGMRARRGGGASPLGRVRVGDADDVEGA